MRRGLALLGCIAAAGVITAAGMPVAGRAHGSPARRGSGEGVFPPGRNMVENGGAEVGDASANGWDAVTIPGWQIVRGLPTVARYGTSGFPSATGPGPASRGRQLFAGGAGGTAVLTQQVPIRTPGGPRPANARFSLSGWLGAGTTPSYSGLEVRFESPSGSSLGTSSVPEVTGKEIHPGHGLVYRVAVGPLPTGTAKAEVSVILGTKLTDYDGPYSPVVGYDRSVADNVSFSLSFSAVAPRPLVPPAAHVPRFRHVFLVYMENQDYRSIVGNTATAPFMNSLLHRGSVLSNAYAEEHPSDGNYLALAGGSTFGLPLTDPLEENPDYTIDARNIGDLVDAAHESWRGYLQSADGPCDDTVHGYYWDDDLPFLYFKDIRDRPAYCSSHLVPLSQMTTDLRSAATTPNFAWISPNDCADMEGCGIKAGDTWLAQTLGAVFKSPAWTSQPSLMIITFDEDAVDYERPAQRVPTIIVGSRYVKKDYVSTARYTHYSLLRTIEAGLGLGTLTDNDRYANAVNDVFTTPESPAQATSADDLNDSPAQATSADDSPARRTWSNDLNGSPAQGSASQRRLGDGPDGSGRNVPDATARAVDENDRPALLPGSLRGSQGGSRRAATASTAYIVDSASDAVTPVNLARHRAGRRIAVGRDPVAIAIAPGGGTAYVVNYGSNSVTPIDTATNRAGQPIQVGTKPDAVAVTPDGMTAYVVDSESSEVTPINTATGRAEPPITVGAQPVSISITPSGRTAYVVDQGAGAVTPITTATDRPGPAIPVGSFPFLMAITPDGAMGFVADYGSDTVTPIRLANNHPTAAIHVGGAPDAIAITPNGSTAFVVDGNSEAVTPIDTATLRAGAEIRVGYSPTAIAVSPAGSLAYVVNTISGSVTPIDTITDTAEAPISVGVYSYPTAVTFAAGGSVAVVLGTYNGTVVEIRPSGGQVSRLKVGYFPSAVALRAA